MKQAVAFDIEKYLVLNGIPRGPKSKIYFVDPVNGSDSNMGTSFKAPLKTITAAEALTVGDQHDCVVMLAGDTADNPATAIAWDKDYTHLVGLSGDLPGMGQRCRIVGTAALDLAQLVTFSGVGCIVRNIQFFNGGDATGALGAVIVSGGRNYFKNCFFAGMGHATPAGQAAGFSLTVSGAENYFEDCTIGLDTIVRTSTNAELIISNVRNRFRHCDIRKHSVTSGNFLVRIDNTLDLRDTIFDDCLFFCYTPNWASGSADVFDMPASGNTHYVILRGECQLVGVGLGWGDVVTHIYGAGPLPNVSMGVSTNPTT